MIQIFAESRAASISNSQGFDGGDGFLVLSQDRFVGFFRQQLSEQMRNVCSTDLHSSATGRLRRQRGDKSLWIWNTEDARKQKQWRLHGLREDARGSGGLMCDAVCRDQAHHPAHLFHHLQQSQNLHQLFATPTPTLRLHFSPANSFLKFPL